MNAKMEFTRNILPGVSRTATEKEKKLNEDLTTKIMALKSNYMKSKKGQNIKQPTPEVDVMDAANDQEDVDQDGVVEDPDDDLHDNPAEQPQPSRWPCDPPALEMPTSPGVVQGSSNLPQVSVSVDSFDPPSNMISIPPMTLPTSEGGMNVEQGATEHEQGAGPPEQGAGNQEQGAVEGPRISRMRAMFNLDEGKVLCRCLIRRWKFCDHIKSLAGGKVSGDLVKTSSLKERHDTDRNTPPPSPNHP